MLGTILSGTGDIATGLGVLTFWRRDEEATDLLFFVSNASWAVRDGLTRNWTWLGINIFLAALFLFFWRRDRRKRKRAPKLIGARARALIAAMVAKMRESSKPRTALRPAPGGAR